MYETKFPYRSDSSGMLQNTNAYHTTANVLDELSDEFFFPACDIAWDIEPIYGQ